MLRNIYELLSVFQNVFDCLPEVGRESGGQVGSTVQQAAFSTVVKDIALEPNWLGLKPNFLAPRSVTLGKWTFLCVSVPICKITIACWVVVRTHEM